MKKLVAFICFTALTLSLTGCGVTSTTSTSGSSGGSASSQGTSAKSDTPAQSSDEILIKLAHSSPDTVPMHKGAVKFSEICKELSGGRINVEVYANSVLGSERECIEAVIMGNIQMCIPSTSPVVNFVPDYYLFDLPFPFKDRETAWEILDSEAGKKVFASAEKAGLKTVAVFENGFRNVSCNGIRNVPEEFKGLKIRTMENDIHLELWKALKANPTPMAFGEVYTALQQKTIDAQENPLFQIEASKFYEVNDTVVETRHIFTPYVLLMNLDFFDSLSDDDKKIVAEAAAQATEYERQLSIEQEEISRQNLKDNGCEVFEVTDEQRKNIVDATKHIDDMIVEKVENKELAQEFIQAIRSK